jgi:hypothetical protein
LNGFAPASTKVETPAKPSPPRRSRMCRARSRTLTTWAYLLHIAILASRHEHIDIALSRRSIPAVAQPADATTRLEFLAQGLGAPLDEVRWWIRMCWSTSVHANEQRRSTRERRGRSTRRSSG